MNTGYQSYRNLSICRILLRTESHYIVDSARFSMIIHLRASFMSLSTLLLLDFGLSDHVLIRRKIRFRFLIKHFLLLFVSLNETSNFNLYTIDIFQDDISLKYSKVNFSIFTLCKCGRYRDILCYDTHISKHFSERVYQSFHYVYLREILGGYLM